MAVRRFVALIHCVCAAFCTSHAAYAVTPYSVQDLGTLGNYSNALGINDDGEVVGVYRAPGMVVGRPFVWRGGVMQDLGTLGGPEGLAYAINNSGQITGFTQNAAGLSRAFRYTTGVMQDLGTLGGSTSEGRGINSFGDVAGESWANAVQYHAFLHSNGQMMDLGALASGTIGNSSAYDVNDQRTVVGYTYVPSGQYLAFVYRSGQMQTIGTLPGGFDSRAIAINNRDQIVGYSFQGSRHEAFLFEAGVFTPLTPGQWSGPHTSIDINENGEIVGTIGNDNPRAFYWADGVRHDLNDLSQTPGWQLLRANGINNRGQIVGFGMHAGQPRGFLATPIPEPCAAITVAALALLVGARSRR